MNITIDVDGVVADMIPEWLGRYNNDYGDNLKSFDIKAWDTSKYVKPECGKKIYRYLEDPTLYDNVLPIPHALEEIASIRMEHDVYFVTSCVEGMMGRKYRWLNDHGFAVSIKNYIEASNKGMICGDILVDDYPVNLQKFHGKGILFSQPWNFGTPAVAIAGSWLDVSWLIRRIAGER